MKFYAAVGDNGGVITDWYDRALYNKKYLRGHVYIRKFTCFEDAEEYLLDHIMLKAPFGCPIPEHCRLNQFLSIRKLMETA